jgi:hypothetical protein
MHVQAIKVRANEGLSWHFNHLIRNAEYLHD